MNAQAPLLFVLVDAVPGPHPAQAPGTGRHAGPARLGQQILAVGTADPPACVLVQSGEPARIDAELEEWLVEAATRLVELRRRYSRLTPREREALPLITDGLLNKQAASVLGISQSTLQIHRGRIMQKMAARSFAELVRMADALGISGPGGCKGAGCRSARPSGTPAGVRHAEPESAA